MELIPFRPIAVFTAYALSAYSRERLLSGAQDLGVVTDFISGELR